MPIRVEFDDLFTQDVDVIVNPANEHMLHGGGVAGAMARAAGLAMVEESEAQAPILTGEAIITTAGDLPQKAIVHAVGPVWDDGSEGESVLLWNAYYSAVKVAATHGHTSIAFPAISCGVFGYPVEKAAPVAVAALRKAQEAFPAVEDIRICLLDDEHYAAFFSAVGSVT